MFDHLYFKFPKLYFGPYFGPLSHQFMTFKSLFGPFTILSLIFVTFRVSRFHVSYLTHETFKLGLQNTLNMTKTTRVYFGVLHGVPSVALLLHLFSPKDTTEGFIYFSRRSGAPLVISDLPSSHRPWKGRFFFISGFNWEYNPSDRDDTLGVPTTWNAPDNLREYLCCFRYDFPGGDRVLLILYYLHVSQVLALTLAPKIMS